MAKEDRTKTSKTAVRKGHPLDAIELSMQRLRTSKPTTPNCCATLMCTHVIEDDLRRLNEYSHLLNAKGTPNVQFVAQSFMLAICRPFLAATDVTTEVQPTPVNKELTTIVCEPDNDPADVRELLGKFLRRVYPLRQDAAVIQELLVLEDSSQLQPTLRQLYKQVKGRPWNKNMRTPIYTLICKGVCPDLVWT